MTVRGMAHLGNLMGLRTVCRPSAMARRLASLLLPGLCPVCLGAPVDGPHRACHACSRELQTLPRPRCPGCGGTVDGILDVCGECAGGEAPPWHHAVSVFGYGGAVRELVHRFKYRGAVYLAPLFARRMADSWHEFGDGTPDVVTPVPLHWTRRFRRGYNQAELLTGLIAAHLGVPQRSLLGRVCATRQQALLDIDRRKTNMAAGVFRVRRQEIPASARILVVDDVITTGATLGAAARALHSAGVGTVRVLTLARG
jgi:ComF family protein